MKIKGAGMLTVAALTGTAPVALAAATRGDGSQLAIYIFLGMCALIIVVQLFPMFIVLYGLLKGLALGRKEASEVPEEVVSDK